MFKRHFKRQAIAWATLPAVFIAASCSRSGPGQSNPGKSSPDQPTPLDDSRLRSTDGDTSNWVMYGRTYDDHRFSPLKQIDEQTVGRLGLAWSRELGTTRGLEGTPLVENGVI